MTKDADDLAAAMAQLDFDAADRILARIEAEDAGRRDAVISARVTGALLRGKVLDAEALIARMQDPAPALAYLAASQRLGVSCAEISRMERGLPPKESAHG